MFGRISTAPVPQSFNINQYYYYGLNTGGVFLGKKFEDDYVFEQYPYPDPVTLTYRHYQPKLDGWVEWDPLVYGRYYPQYDLPDDLPPWIVDSERFLIGADPLIGPFTFHEAMHIFSVVKSMKAENISDSYSFSGNGVSLTVSDSLRAYYVAPSGFTSEDEFFPINESDPNSLFTFKEKVYRVRMGGGDASQGTPGQVGTYGNASVYTQKGLDFFVNGYALSIIMDIDNPSDYYICAPDWVFYGSAGCSAAEITEIPQEPTPFFPDPPPIYLGSYSSASGACSLYLSKQKFYVSGYSDSPPTTLDVGGSFSQSDDNSDVLIKYVSTNVTFKFGGIEKTMPAYGLQYITRYRQYDKDAEPLSLMSMPDIFPSDRIEVTADTFWPYKNADDEDVYNTSTGAIINDPIP